MRIISTDKLPVLAKSTRDILKLNSLIHPMLGDTMYLRKKISSIATAVALSVALMVSIPQSASAAHACTIGHTSQGFAEARCFDASPGGDKYRVVWGCIHRVTGSFRYQYGNIASVNLGNSSTVPNCHWYEKGHGTRYVETIWS